MLSFLRKIRRSLIDTGSTRKPAGRRKRLWPPVTSPIGRYLLYSIGEIALVVMGILIALQINNWNVEKKEAAIEKGYMINLLSDLAKDRSNLLKDVEFGPIPVFYNDSLFSELQKRPLQGREKRIYHFLLLYTNGILITYHDRTMSQLRNSGGFGLIENQKTSDAILDYDVHMREAIQFTESSRSNHFINNDILLNDKMYELYRVMHLKASTIMYKDQIDRVAYPDDLILLSYEELDIKIALNSMAKVRTVDEHIYQKAVEALDMNIKLDSLIRDEYLQDSD